MTKKLISIIIMSILLFSAFPAFEAGAETELLSLGKKYTVEYESSIENAWPEYMIPASADGKFTDGVKATTLEYGDKAWVQLYRGTYVTITIDLEAEYAIEQVKFSQLQQKGAGVHAAREMYYTFSLDGENFGALHEREDKESVTLANERVENDLFLDTPVRARYVRLRISNDVNGFLDEIEVYGSSDMSEAITPEKADYIEYVNSFPSDIDGLRNISLAYSGKYYRGAEGTAGHNTKEMFDTIVGYTVNGKIIDTMFDGILFLPLQPTSDHADTTSAIGFGKKTGWIDFAENTLGTHGDYNLKGLNASVANLKQSVDTLSDSYKYPVYISVPYINYSTSVFGEIDGKDITPNSYENRLKIIKWYIDYVKSEFDAAGYENLQLNGFYWHNELVSYVSSDHEVELIQGFNAYAHEKGFSTTWIPYYCSPGFNHWKELGFTAVVLQPGYAFVDASGTGQNKKIGTVDDSLDSSFRYGLGIEFEVGNISSSEAGIATESRNRYKAYIEAATKRGMSGQKLAMYYHGGYGGAFYKCATSSDSGLRELYDMTYRYIHGLLSYDPPTVDEGQVYVIKKGERGRFRLSMSVSSGSYKIAEFVKPDNIELDADSSGLIIYNASSDFVGDTSFKISFKTDTQVAALVEVKIIVSETVLDVSKMYSEPNEIGENKAAVFISADGISTGTGSGAYEVVFDGDGKITSVGGNNNTVPAEGGVVSATGSMQEYLLANAKVGSKVIYDSKTGNLIIREDESGKTSSTGKWVAIGAVSAVAIAAVACIAIYLKKKKRRN